MTFTTLRNGALILCAGALSLTAAEPLAERIGHTDPSTF
jgi:hypothetical protein